MVEQDIRGAASEGEAPSDNPGDTSLGRPSAKGGEKGRRPGRSARDREARDFSAETFGDEEYSTMSWNNASSVEESAPESAFGPNRSTRVRKKWRGGPPPAAPPLDATFDNVYKVPKLYSKWVRRVDAWKLRVRHYKPFAEAALDLADAITGDGALMIEKIPLDELYIPGGIDKIVSMMKVFDEVAIHSVGDVLENWETLRRSDGVTLSKFIGLFLDLESQCKAKGLEVQTGEARAYKFLRACAMSPDHQRQFLVESRGYDFDSLVGAMRTQWPRAAPPVWKGASQTQSPFHRSSPPSGKGNPQRDRPRYPGSSASSISSGSVRSSRVHEATQDWADDAWQADWQGSWPDAWNEAAEPGDAVWTADTPETADWS